MFVLSEQKSCHVKIKYLIMYAKKTADIKSWLNITVTILEKILASVGVEPTTFALLARRSNRLS